VSERENLLARCCAARLEVHCAFGLPALASISVHAALRCKSEVKPFFVDSSLKALGARFEMAVSSITLNTGHCILQLGLGTFCAPKGEVGKAVRIAIELGYRHLDCAAFCERFSSS